MQHETSHHLSFNLKRSLLVAAAATGLLSLAYTGLTPQTAFAQPDTPPASFKPLTAESAAKIKFGEITLEDGTVDTLLFNYGPLDPNADDDQDGVLNKDEIGTYELNGKTYIYYKSHPRFEDTDGDGYLDNADSDPLSWNVSERDAIIGQELTYREDKYINRVLEGNRPLADSELYKKDGEAQGRMEYRLMNREWGPYWIRQESFHNNSGFDASLFKFSNKTLPFLKEGVYILAIRGTAGSADVGADTKLGIGLWPDQATDAINVAKIINARRDTIKDLSVTGHSLGGYLTQIFTTHSRGLYYGNTKNGYTTNNELYWEPNKFDNRNVTRGYTFNAPKIVASFFNQYGQEYARLSEIISRELPVKHYVVANDSITALTGAPKGYIALEASNQGHSSRSFFEDRYINQPGFSVGKRRGLSGTGYQDPNIMLIQFNQVSTIRFVKADGTELSSTRLALNEKDLKNLDFAKRAPENYVIDPNALNDGDKARATYGQTTTFKALGKPVQVTYHYDVIDENSTSVPDSALTDEEKQVLADNIISTRYEENYTAPDQPISPNIDYRYELVDQDSLKPLDPLSLTQDKTVTVTLRRVPITVKTTVRLIQENVGTVLASKDYETRPSQTSPIAFDENLIPEHYELAPGQDNKKQIKPGSVTEFILRGEPITVNYTYTLVDGAGTQITEADMLPQEREAFKTINRTGRYQENLPATTPPTLDNISEDFSYEIVNPDAFDAIPAEDMTQSQNRAVTIKRTEKQIETSLRFIDSETGAELHKLNFTTKPSQKDKIVVSTDQIPEHYVLAAGEKDKLTLEPGTHSSVKLEGESLKLTYRYAIQSAAGTPLSDAELTESEKQAFAPVVKTVRYKQAQPAFMPVDFNKISPDYSYELINPKATEPITAENMTASKEIVIQLKRAEHQVGTRVQFKDAANQEVLKTLTFTNKPSDTDPITISAQELPSMYELMPGEDAKLQVTPGDDVVILLQGKPITISWHYQLVDETGKSIDPSSMSNKERAVFQDVQQQARYKQATNALAQPDFTTIDQDYTYELLTPEAYENISSENMIGDIARAIRIKRTPLIVQTHVRFVGQDGKPLAEFVLKTKPSEKDPINVASKLPEHYVFEQGGDAFLITPGSGTHEAPTTVKLQGKPLTVSYTYELVDEQSMTIDPQEYTDAEKQAFTAMSAQGRYKEELSAQDSPDLSQIDQDYTYELLDPEALDAIPADLMLTDKDIKLKVKRTAVKVETTLEYKDAANNTVLKVEKRSTKPSEKEDIDFSAIPLPEGYKLADSEGAKLTLKPGEHGTVILEKIKVTPDPQPEPEPAPIDPTDPEPQVPTPDPSGEPEVPAPDPGSEPETPTPDPGSEPETPAPDPDSKPEAPTPEDSFDTTPKTPQPEAPVLDQDTKKPVRSKQVDRIPRTGDNASMGLAVGTSLAALISLTVSRIIHRRKNKHDS